jgi:hypothetical protein
VSSTDVAAEAVVSVSLIAGVLLPAGGAHRIAGWDLRRGARAIREPDEG